MLVGGDLGFPYLVFLVAVVVVVPAISFVVRRKWRHAVERREEIKRLLVFASEEAARAELEATEGYYYPTDTTISSPVPASVSENFVPSLKPQYECAVCYCPTTTRCAKCKAVRYCSGRCQIIHWRQGHKDACRPYIAVNPINDVGGSSFEQGNHKDYSHIFDTEGQQTATPVERFREGSDDNRVEFLTHQQETKSTFQSTSDLSNKGHSAVSVPIKSSVETSSIRSGGSEGVDLSQFPEVIPDNFETVKSQRQTLVSPARKSTGSGDINQNKSNLSEGGKQSESLSSSCWTDDGSNESSSSEPSSTSSSFLSGTIHSKKSSIDELGSFVPASSSEATNRNMTDSRPSLSFSFDVSKGGSNSGVIHQFTAASIISDESGPKSLGSKKSNDETILSKEMFNDGMKYKRPSTCATALFEHRDVDACRDLTKSEIKETKISPSPAASHRASVATGHSTILTDAKAFSGMPSGSHEKSNHVSKNKNIDSHTLKSREVSSSLSKDSNTHSTSSTGRHAYQSTKSVKVDDGNHRVASSLSQPSENSQSARNGLKTSMLNVVDQLKSSKLSRHSSFQGDSETTHRYGRKGIFSYEMFVKLYNWKKVELQPCGLINCGNSCYANAVLQCLSFTPPLTAYLLQGLHSKACQKREWCFTCEFEGLVLKTKDGNSPLSPIRILSRIESIGSNLGHGREEDAHEFLRYAIDTLQSGCLKEVGTNTSNSLEEETTLIGLTFGGYLRSKIKCMRCGGKSERHDRMMDLTVEIEGDIGTLEEALNKFTCTEILDGENKYKCSRCKSYEKAKKKLTLLEAPNVLTIALKRFQSGKFGKLNKSIRFPEILDMAPYVSGTSDKSPIYRLYGVVVHLDIMNAAFSGHYVCYVKNVQNRWFKIDDSKVKEVDLHSVLTKGAYMLLYARCSPRAPRSIRSSLTHHHDPIKHKVAPSFMARPHPTPPWEHSIRHRSLEEESSSSSDNSELFSESCSCSTEASHRDSTSTEDPIFGEWERDFWRNSSDSDTSSSSSFPSPLYDDHGINIKKECRSLLGGSNRNSYRETNLDRSGDRATNPFGSSKQGVIFRKSTIRGSSD